MDAFWEMVTGWTPLGQGLFFLILLGTIATVIERLAHYLTVMFRGWPDPFVQRGELTVVAGVHEIHVPTVMEPRNVWVSFSDGINVPVCQGDVDCIGVSIDREGFTLRLHVHSTERDIRWRAEF